MHKDCEECPMDLPNCSTCEFPSIGGFKKKYHELEDWNHLFGRCWVCEGKLGECDCDRSNPIQKKRDIIRSWK